MYYIICFLLFFFLYYYLIIDVGILVNIFYLINGVVNNELFSHCLSFLAGSYYLIISAIIFSLFIVIFKFNRTKKLNLFTLVSLFLIIGSCIITTLGDEGAGIGVFSNTYIYSAISLLFFMLFIFIVFINVFMIFYDKQNLCTKSIFISFSSFCLAIQFYLMQVLKEDYEYLAAEGYDFFELIFEHAGNNVLYLLIGVIVASFISIFVYILGKR